MSKTKILKAKRRPVKRNKITELLPAFSLRIINDNEDTIWGVFGITGKRGKELEAQINKLTTEDICITELMVRCSTLCLHQNEYGYLLFCLGQLYALNDDK